MTACGVDGEIDGQEVEAGMKEVQRMVARFEGAKLAPPPEVMAYWASGKVTERVVFQGDMDLFSECSRASLKAVTEAPDSVKPVCRGHLLEMAEAAVFTPEKCEEATDQFVGASSFRKGVVCWGEIDTPAAKAYSMIVFHKPDGENWVGMTKNFSNIERY